MAVDYVDGNGEPGSYSFDLSNVVRFGNGVLPPAPTLRQRRRGRSVLTSLRLPGKRGRIHGAFWAAPLLRSSSPRTGRLKSSAIGPSARTIWQIPLWLPLHNSVPGRNRRQRSRALREVCRVPGTPVPTGRGSVDWLPTRGAPAPETEAASRFPFAPTPRPRRRGRFGLALFLRWPRGRCEPGGAGTCWKSRAPRLWRC